MHVGPLILAVICISGLIAPSSALAELILAIKHRDIRILNNFIDMFTT